MSRYTYGPRRNKNIQEAWRLFDIFDGTRTFVISTHVLGDVLAELNQQTHLARQYDRALKHFDKNKLRAKIRDLNRRIRVTSDTLRLHQRLTGAQHTTLIDVLDTRKPLRRKGKR